ncbi:FAD-binding protein, partial [Salmonella enterica subsp. enterica serovar Virginia]|nr:FAD-binding protein [Salmonella enterica subsp. enterica serovar Virginia]
MATYGALAIGAPLGLSLYARAGLALPALLVVLLPIIASGVIFLSKGPVSEGSTFYAQGGIAAVFDETDSIASHVEDTLIAGAG